jgi:hypothetical protein
MFFKAYKTKRTADAVLQQVTPFVTMVTRFGGGVTPAKLVADDYLRSNASTSSASGQVS